MPRLHGALSGGDDDIAPQTDARFTPESGQSVTAVGADQNGEGSLLR